MREILFRGKLKHDNLPNRKGDWVYGHYAELKDGDRTVPCIYGYGEIIPETLGEYTYSTDKNGKRIFEGDIIEFYFFDKTRRNGELVEVKNTTTMLIEWYKSSFYMRELFRDYRLNEKLEIITEKIYIYRGNKAQGVYESNSSYFVEVIGNIHDNPELMDNPD